MNNFSSGTGSDEGELLLEKTVTMPNRWEQASIDLAGYGGRGVRLSLSLKAEEEGTLGFWGNPVIRSRNPVSVAATGRPRSGMANEQPPQGVILIVADTLRRDHLNFYGHNRDTAPTLSQMAQAGALFRDNIAQATWTKVSVPSILTSLYPLSHRVVALPDRISAAATTMAEVYRDAGYATVGYSSVPFTGRFSNLHQ